MATKKATASFAPKIRVDFQFDFDKFLAAVHYIASRSVPELAKYKICKLLFFADKYHLLRYGRPIIGDRYCALQYGPIPSRSLDLLNEFIETNEFGNARDEIKKMNLVLTIDKKHRYPRFSSRKKIGQAESDVLSSSDVKALDHAMSRYGKMSFYQLKDITHSDYAYRQAAEELTDLRYEDFFVGDPDAIDGAFDEMVENCYLRRVFPPGEEF